MRKKYERQIGEKNTEINMLKDKLVEANKKIDMLGLELAGLKDANDKNNMEKLREIEKLKQVIEDLNNRISSLQSNSSDQMKELERLLKDKTAKFENEMKELINKYESQIASLSQRHLE